MYNIYIMPLPDPQDHLVKIVDSALSGSSVEHTVKMSVGEMFLFHVLLQEYGIYYAGEDRFIPLMERNKARIDSVKNV